MQVARLLLKTSVDESHKLVCQAPGCGRAIAVNVHVIQDERGAVRVVGSGCFGKLAGHVRAAEVGAAFEGFEGRRLTAEERALLAADTAAFVARIEASLAAQQKAAEVERSRLAEAQQFRDKQAAVGTTGFNRSSQGELPQEANFRPGPTRGSARGVAADQLARFRAQQARQAAQVAMQRRPELAEHSLDAVADAMAQAKVRYLSRGLRMDSPGAREAIESEAIAVLAERTFKAPRR